MSIKIGIALELADEESMGQLLKGLRQLLLEQRRAPKYKVTVKYETENEEIGDDFPLDLGALGVPLEVDAPLATLRPDTPMERYLNSLEGEGS